jgi:hypothetical protein
MHHRQLALETALLEKKPGEHFAGPLTDELV